MLALFHFVFDYLLVFRRHLQQRLLQGMKLLRRGNIDDECVGKLRKGTRWVLGFHSIN